MELTQCQAAAEARFEDFLDDPHAVTFGLFGYAGVGKSAMTARFIKNCITGTTALLAAPTHKAAHIMRRFLDRSGIEHQRDIQKQLTTPVVGTTAQLLGIMPIIGDEQDASTMKFAKSTKGFIERVDDLDWIIIDETSMLSGQQFRMVRDMARDRGARVLVVGDPGQLPPVNADPLPYEKIAFKTMMRQVCRTDDETGITALATAIRSGKRWQSVRGTGVSHVADAAGTFLADLTEPMTHDESEWSVYVAYRNVSVNAINEAACQKLYGHSRFDIAEGEVVLANNSLHCYAPGVGKMTLCTNGEALVIESMGRSGRWGVNVTVRSLATGEDFVAEYLPERDRSDPNHPYNLEVVKLRAEAQRLEALRDPNGETERRAAWVKYFNLRDNTVLSVSHPFALTSHKSQGSTYKRAYVDAADMAPFDPRALYVGATRPSDELIIG